MTTMSPLYTTTYETGGSTKPAEAVYPTPGRVHLDDDFASLFGGRLNPPFIIDFLSATLMHEQCGRHLYRSVAGRTNNPMLKGRYEHFGNETEEHVDVLRTLISNIGGDPGYVSPSARGTEKLDHGALEATFALDGSLDLMTRELVMLDAVVLAETVDHANWQAINQITQHLPAGGEQDAFQHAVDAVLPQEQDHIGWATTMRCRLVLLQATHPHVAGLAAGAETLIDQIRTLFSDET